MATQITNQATLTYTYGQNRGTAASNIATTMLQEPLTVSKSSLSSAYRPGDDVTYMITMNNNGSAPLSNVTVEDDLGTYSIAGPAEVTPLTYTGPAQLYINGAFVSELQPTQNANSITFTIQSLPAGANAMILYKASVNEYALAETGSVLTNTAEFSAAGMSEDLDASHTMDVLDYADVRIIKSMSPNPVTEGSVLTYIFTIYNYGNVDASDVVLSDTFTPAPSMISVTINGAPVPASDYNYQNGVFTLPASGSSMDVTVPAAKFSQEPQSGKVTVSPGTTVIVVNGTI